MEKKENLKDVKQEKEEGLSEAIVPTGRVSDVITGEVECDEFVKIETLFNQEVLILEVADRSGDYGNYQTIVITKDGGKTRIACNTGSEVIQEKIAKVIKGIGLPFLATFIEKRGKNGKYYDIV